MTTNLDETLSKTFSDKTYILLDILNKYMSKDCKKCLDRHKCKWRNTNELT